MIHYIEQFQINIYAILMLLVILFLIKTKTQFGIFSKKLLRIVIILNVAALIVEPITWISDGSTSHQGYLVCYISNFLLVMLGPILAGVAASYADYKLFSSVKCIKRSIMYQLPSLVVFILLIINIFEPFIFSVDAATRLFKPGPLQWLTYLIILGIYLYVIVMMQIHRRKTNARTIYIVVIFFGLPIIGMLVQMFYIQLFFAWSTMGLGILIAYVLLETSSGERDSLTRLFSRASYEEYVQYLMEKKKNFKVLMIDLDGFKEINDRNGHHLGDQILIEFARILQQVFNGEKMISRLAGDEFIIVIQREINLLAAITLIEKKCAVNILPQMQNLRFSYGCQTFSDEMSFDELYIKVDREMYLNKNSVR